MRVALAIGFALLQVFLKSAFGAGNTLQLSSADFDKVKAILCDSETIEQLQSIRKTCGVGDFTIWSEDLNGDGKTERLFFGPAGLCGAHGNCPFTILREVKGEWELLVKPACRSNNCLGWANDFATTVLPAKHNGYRDLLIGTDSGSFYWTKSLYQWDGSQYKMPPNAVTYYLADSEGKLKQVSQSRWEQCSRHGENCL